MEHIDTAPAHSPAESRPGILYPLLLIAAIAVIVFSVAGTATILGWMPEAVSKTDVAPRGDTAPAGKAAPTGNAGSRAARPAAGACADCGVVDSVRAVEVKGQGTGLGAVAGGVVGGLLGNQIGRGGGRTAATVVGAGAGAYAGHEIEKNVKNTVRYQVRVRMGDGTYRTFYERAQPAWAVGQKVRVTDHGVVAAG